MQCDSNNGFNKEPILPPNILFREFESGRMSREEFHAAMSFHAIELIDEMEEDRRNPLEAFVETIRNKRLAHSLSRKHGEPAVREILLCLLNFQDFLCKIIVECIASPCSFALFFENEKKKPILEFLIWLLKKVQPRLDSNINLIMPRGLLENLFY